MFSRVQRLALVRLRVLRDAPSGFDFWLIRAAGDGRTARRIWLGLALFVGAVALLGQSWAAATVVHTRLWDVPPETVDEVVTDFKDGYAWPYVLGLVVAAFLVVIELAILRLIWLRLRVRQVLRNRDRCPFCGHGIRGVPLTPELNTICPECSLVTPAVAGWNEVNAAIADRPTFAPATGLAPLFWNRRRIVFTARVMGVVLAVGIIGYTGWWSVREVGIRREAAKARADRLGSDALNAKIRVGSSARRPEGPLVRDLIVRISDRIRQQTDAFWRERAAEIEPLGEFLPDPSYVSFSGSFEDDPRSQKARELSEELVRGMHDDGVYELLDQLPAATPWTDDRISTIDEKGSPGTLGRHRAVLRLCIARMKLARDARDNREFERAMAAATAIANALQHGPLLIDWLVAASAEEMILRSAADILMEHPDRQWIDVLQSSLDALVPGSLSRVIQNEQLVVLDSLAWYFSEPSRIRKGLHAPELETDLGIGAGLNLRSLFDLPSDVRRPRLGDYAENRTLISAAYAAFGEQADLDPWQRAARPVPPQSSDLVILDSILPGIGQSLRSADRLVLRRRAVRVMLELERHRLDHGEYPGSIAELALASKCLDPFSGKPFGYRRIEPASDPQKRGYLLWTVGHDGVDNGGQIGERQSRDAALRPAGDGSDMILNDPRWY